VRPLVPCQFACNRCDRPDAIANPREGSQFRSRDRDESRRTDVSSVAGLCEAGTKADGPDRPRRGRLQPRSRADEANSPIVLISFLIHGLRRHLASLARRERTQSPRGLGPSKRWLRLWRFRLETRTGLTEAGYKKKRGRSQGRHALQLAGRTFPLRNRADQANSPPIHIIFSLDDLRAIWLLSHAANEPNRLGRPTIAGRGRGPRFRRGRTQSSGRRLAPSWA